MTGSPPLHVIWWLVSRASGIVALTLISLSVLMGLAMATKTLRGTRAKRAIARLHEHTALIAIMAIGAHGASLLGDGWLRPGWRGIAVPFALSYRPAFTGIGIITGYLAILLGPSFYLRKRIGARRWRKLHRATVAVWILGLVHTLGSGSDASKPWLQYVVLAPAVPIVYLLVVRLLGAQPRRARRTRPSCRGGGGAGSSPQRTQGVEDHRQIDHLLQQRPGDRRQIAECGDHHRGDAQAHPDQHTLAGDRERAPTRVHRVGDAVDAVDHDHRIGRLR
jgi:sulfoxide reductase heme-binding subunit YedZ